MFQTVPQSAPIITLPALAAARAPLAEATPYSPEPWFEMARREFSGDNDTAPGDAPRQDAHPTGN